eukprot:TRINITY_DN4478_c0_g1_i1.p1 TRINITY_DN4478_c0_g1~~TRINITY_DN4478_c0_g1_i1.p1  ORF type:complete len:259 (+),score=62.01 TRINITY_DN4478_c0_g1_i1:437-1213(+)
MKSPFTESEVKCLMKQLLNAVAYLHDNWIIHRDLKLSNLLFENGGTLKLADFGLARSYGFPLKSYTPRVVTLWYRPPELLLGSTVYHTAIDMWGVGCIFGELLNKEVLLKGMSEMDQLTEIFKLLGSPNDKIWPEFSSLPHAKMVNIQQPYSTLRHRFEDLSNEGFDLLERMLTYDPKKRISAREALNHPYFSERPLPKAPEMMPSFPVQWDEKTKTNFGFKGKRQIQEKGDRFNGDLFGKKENPKNHLTYVFEDLFQ